LVAFLVAMGSGISVPKPSAGIDLYRTQAVCRPFDRVDALGRNRSGAGSRRIFLSIH
jgi:hypothetical protein